MRRRNSRRRPQRTTRPDTYSYPGTNNRLQSIALGAGGTRSFTYDAAGNVTYDNRSGQGFGYTYDNAGRMASFSLNGVVQAEYAYNQLGQKIIRRLTQTGVTIHSVYGPDGNRIAEYNEATGALIRQYIWLQGAPIAVIEGGVISFVRSDHIGRPVFATDSAGVKVWTAAYLPFGGVRVSTGTPPTARFPGQWFQSETGLHQNWMRDYDPTTGRYMQADPLGLVDGAGLFGYARQNPGRWVDPRGEQTYGFEQRPFSSPAALPFDYRETTWPDDPLEPFHDFPTTFDPEIWQNGYSCKPGRLSGNTFSLNTSGPDLDWGYLECRCLDGALNGVLGRYEVGVRNPFVFENPFNIFSSPRTTVVHRNFRPYQTLRP